MNNLLQYNQISNALVKKNIICFFKFLSLLTKADKEFFKKVQSAFFLALNFKLINDLSWKNWRKTINYFLGFLIIKKGI